MRQPATGITQNLGNHNRKKDRTAVQFSSVLWIFSVHRTEPANTILDEAPLNARKGKGLVCAKVNWDEEEREGVLQWVAWAEVEQDEKDD
jgi:hypothetical protein